MGSETLTRRRFVQGLAAGGVVAGLGDWKAPAWARPNGLEPAELRGTSLDLAIGETLVNITGAPRIAQTINGSLPGPLLRLREGDTVTLRVRNALEEDTSIHWHGLILPANMDGVPGLSFHGIHPGETYTYRFQVRQHGTYWYHSHSGFQEQRGVYGPLVIEPREPEPDAATTASTSCCSSDWTDENPERVFRKLKKESDYYNFRQRTIGDFVHDVRATGWKRRSRTAGRGRDAHERRRPRRRDWRHLHLPDERSGAGRPTGRACSSRASACACASSTARR